MTLEPEAIKSISNWYKVWFDSPYYHLLYQNRDEQEAEAFISNLLNCLNPKSGSAIMDLACGAGRHSMFLASKGFDVTGVDLSIKSIRKAKVAEAENLHFYQHDIRNYFRINYYNYIFNFFTSFGYFEHESDNIKTLRAANWGLKDGGILVIDFFNIHTVLQKLIPQETKQIDGVTFNIQRSVFNDRIVKEIEITDGNKVGTFTEAVQALALEDFQGYFSKTGFVLEQTFGDYQLNPYQPEISDRLILVARKHAE
jgi:2-polyprenyl-3-methyl-5-hydroxy-6-metoxy-1,4-benzoquinol methylase